MSNKAFQAMNGAMQRFATSVTGGFLGEVVEEKPPGQVMLVHLRPDQVDGMPEALKWIRRMRFAIIVLSVVLGAVIAYLIAVAPKAGAAPYICYDPRHQHSDLLCAGTDSQLPPGYSYQDPGTWQPWPKYAPVPGGSYR